MNRILQLTLALSMAACSGTDDTTASGEALPPGVFRMDGDVDVDRIFYDAEHRENYCALHPEAPACSELGTARQRWISAEYHGLPDESDGPPCHASDSDNGDCLFPARKRLKYVFDTTNCFPTLDNGDHDPVDAVDGAAIIEGTRQGMERWHGITNGVSVENNACSTGTCMTVSVSCKVLNNGDGGRAGPSGALTTVVSNLPAGPHGGIDQARGRTYSSAALAIDPGRMLNAARFCFGSPTRAQLRQLTRYVAAHETGHVFGFSHFDEGPDNLMFPFIECSDTAAPVFATPFVQALATLNTSGGGATILDHNLETLGP